LGLICLPVVSLDLPELMVFLLTSQARPPAAFLTLLVTLEFAFRD